MEQHSPDSYGFTIDNEAYLAAQETASVVLVLQGLDASGKVIAPAYIAMARRTAERATLLPVSRQRAPRSAA